MQRTPPHWQRIVFALYALCAACCARLRPAGKRLVHLLTGRCEIERICMLDSSVNKPLMLARSLALSKQLRAINDSLADVDNCAQRIVSTKQMRNERTVHLLRPLLMQIHQRRVLLSTLQQQAATHVTDQHQALLDELWQLLKATDCPVWEEIGFQSNNPKTDFRAMGLLGLLNLVQFARTYPKAARHVLAQSNHVTHWFPFAITGINITALLLRALDTPLLDAHLYRHGAHSDCVLALYATFFYHFAAHYHAARPRDVMEFPRLFNEFHTQWHDFHFWQQELPRLTRTSPYTAIDLIEAQL